MQPPCELMVNDFLPNMRGLVSHELSQREVSQNRIASLLGITQARVSHYLSERREMYESNLVRDFEISRQDLQAYSKILADDVSRGSSEGTFTLYSIWKNILFSGAACAVHRRTSFVSADCSICMELHRPSAIEGPDEEKKITDNYILKDLAAAVSLVEKSIDFPLVIPEVSVNMAMCRQNPKKSGDVAAIPGRISRIHGRARALVSPEFGSSNHLSKVLMIFNAKNGEILAAMNLKYDKTVDEIVKKKLRLPVFFTSPNKVDRTRGGSSTALDDRFAGQREEKLLQQLNAIHSPPGSGIFIVVDRGSEGLEPATYLFGSRASVLSELAVRIARSYSSSISLS